MNDIKPDELVGDEYPDDCGPFDRSVDMLGIAIVIILCSAFWFVAGVFAGRVFA